MLERIFGVVAPRHSFLVDLGAGDGERGSSSRRLLTEAGWNGLVVEPDPEQGSALLERYAGEPRVTALQRRVDPGDVEILLSQHTVPKDLDLLIVGLEANDWYVWRAIDAYRPAVVQIQYNAAFVPPQRMVIDYHPFNHWDGSLYFGASIQSLAELGERKGYALLYADSVGRHLFFVDRPLFAAFGIRDNSPLRLYRGSPVLPAIIPALVRQHIDPEGRPLDRPTLTYPEVTIPRRFLIDADADPQ